MALKILAHYSNQNDSVVLQNVTDYSYSHSTGILSVTQAAVAPATGTTSQNINVYAGVMRLEIFPEVTNFPGNSANTPSG